MALETEIAEMTAGMRLLTEAVNKLTLRIALQVTLDAEEVAPEDMQEELESKPEPAKPESEPEAVAPEKPRKALFRIPTPVEDAMDPQPAFDRLDEVRRVSIEMLKIDGKALREIYKRVGGSEKLSELPLHVHGAVIAAIAAWRKEVGK